jgi:hypothetical protein
MNRSQGSHRVGNRSRVGKTSSASVCWAKSGSRTFSGTGGRETRARVTMPGPSAPAATHIAPRRFGRPALTGLDRANRTRKLRTRWRPRWRDRAGWRNSEDSRSKRPGSAPPGTVVRSSPVSRPVSGAESVQRPHAVAREIVAQDRVEDRQKVCEALPRPIAGRDRFVSRQGVEVGEVGAEFCLYERTMLGVRAERRPVIAEIQANGRYPASFSITPPARLA